MLKLASPIACTYGKSCVTNLLHRVLFWLPSLCVEVGIAWWLTPTNPSPRSMRSSTLLRGQVHFCNKYMSSLWLMWVHGYTHTHPSTLLAFLIIAQLSPVLNPLFTFLKTATIPTYYGISIAIPRYIAMQLSTVPFIMTCFIIVILLFAWSCSWHRICGKATFIIFIHVALDSLHIPVHRRRHSYRVISCSSFEL